MNTGGGGADTGGASGGGKACNLTFAPAVHSTRAVARSARLYPLEDKYPDSVVAADFNGDGKPDLAVAMIGDELISKDGLVDVLLNQGDGTFAAPVHIEAGYHSAAVVAADFNGDGRPDLAAVSSGDVSILVNTCSP